MGDHASVHAVEVVVTAHGLVSDSDREYATRRLRAILATVDSAVGRARIDLSDSGEPGVVRPASAKVEVEVGGHATRVHATAETVPDAIDAVMTETADRFDEVVRHGPSVRVRHRHAVVGVGRARTARRRAFRERAVPGREVVRYKCVPTEPETIDRAAADLEVVDHDFFLFENVVTGEDDLLARTPDGYELYEPTATCPLEATVAAVHRATSRPQVATVDEARRALDEGDRPFVFFVDPDSGRGRVLYRRYDGHYGLLVPTGHGEAAPTRP